MVLICVPDQVESIVVGASYQPARAVQPAPRGVMQDPRYGDTAIGVDVVGERVTRIWVASAPEKLRAPAAVALR